MELEKLDGTIVITNYAFKEYLLKEISKSKKLINVTFFSINDLKNRLFFTYDYHAIYYLMEKYGYKYDIAKMYLDNLIYIENKTYNNTKLDKLVEIKKELENNKLLIYDKYFKSYLENKKVIFCGFNYFTLLEKDIIKKLKNISDVEIIDKNYKDYKFKVLSFNTIEEEVEYIAIRVLELIEKGINISNIKISNFNSDYLDTIKKIFSFYNLDIDYNENKVLSTKIAALFFEINGSIEDRINVIKEKYENNEVVKQIIEVCNKYIEFKNIDIILDIIKNELNNISLPYAKTSNMIEIVDYKNYHFTDEMHVFLLDFTSKSIPKVYKDENFITDNIKEKLLIDKTNELNIFEKISTIKNLKSIKNLTVTYKKSSYFENYLPSNLVSDLSLEVIPKTIDLTYSYSNLYSKIKLNKLIDEYLRSGKVTDNLKILYSNFDNLYSTYDNSFKGINKKNLKEYLDSKYNLSYSSMDNYYKCPFKYYLANVLKLDIFEEKFSTYLGSLFHYVLENNLKDNTNIDELINKYVEKSNKKLTNKEKFFIEKIKEDMVYALDFIKEQNNHSKLNNYLFENNFEVVKNGEFTVTFKGIVDKILYKKKDDKTVLMIVDYKTGSTDIDLRKNVHGLSLQLPIYLYLTKNNFKGNILFSGFYIQKVLSGEIKMDTNKTYEQQKYENLKLNGYSNFDKDIISEADSTYKDSKFIKSLKVKDDGNFYYYSKVLENEKIDALINLVDKKIDKAILNINNCNFDIKPKKTEKENIGCKFCKFSDICFKENKDGLYIEFPKDLSFLGGEKNA